MKYIAIAPAKEVFDVKGESLGIEKERSLYRLKGLHRNRVYREKYPTDDKSLVIFKYKSKNKMQKLCNLINEMHNDNFVVVEECFNE